MGKCIASDFILSQLKPDTFTETKNGIEITKEAWVDKLKSETPPLICTKLTNDHAEAKRLAKHGINYDKCLTIIPDLISQCVTKYNSNIPLTIEKIVPANWRNR